MAYTSRPSSPVSCFAPTWTRADYLGSAEIHSSNALLLKLVFTLRRYLAFSRVASLLKRIFPTTTTTSTSRCILDKRLWQQKFSFHKKIFFRPPQKFAKLAQSMWQCGSVAVWQCGSVAVWQCGKLDFNQLGSKKYILEHDIFCKTLKEDKKEAEVQHERRVI